MKDLGPVGQLLSDPSKWTKGAFARTSEGRRTDADSNAATCWCLSGAMQVAYGYLGGSAGLEVVEYLRGEGIVAWNDHPDRTFDDVRKLLEETGI